MTTLVSRTKPMVLCAALAMSPIAAYAGDTASLTPASYSQDVGASERVEAAGLLRVLSQEAANAACHISKNVAADEARELLGEVKAKFTFTLDALEFGNPTKNINGAEKRRKTIERISQVRASWAEMKDATFALLDDPQNLEALATVKAKNEDVLSVASNLTNEISSSYSNPAELLQTDVLLLDFTSRQAMQAQKMGKHACAIWSGESSDADVESLTSTMGLYDATLTALINGMPAMGILAAPTPEISEALKEASQNWSKTKAELNLVLANADVDDSVKENLFHDLHLAMRHMQKVEKLYAVHAKRKYLNTSNNGAANALTD